MVITNMSTFVKKEELEMHPEFPEKAEVDGVAMDEFIDSLSVDLGHYHEDKIADGQQISYWDYLNLPYDEDGGDGNNCLEESLGMYFQEGGIKTEPECNLWGDEDAEDDDDEDGKKMMRLNLSLNYRDVQDAWSDRTLWADDSSTHPTTTSSDTNASYVMEGMAPHIEIEDDKKRREASVLRYKEKRQARLFSKKIRYQVRKLNADNRPRLKGRFVKRDG